MSALAFVDTNVFLYAVDDANLQKQHAAREWTSELWKTRRGRTSFQVLQEFYAKAIQKSLASRQAARAEVKDLLAWRPVPIQAGILLEGWKVQDRYQLSFWDSLIVAAAKAASCQYLLTEDLNAGQDLDGVIVVNPFRSTPDSI